MLEYELLNRTESKGWRFVKGAPFAIGTMTLLSVLTTLCSRAFVMRNRLFGIREKSLGLGNRFVCISQFVLAILICQINDSNAEETIKFNRDIRPILSEYCLACHGFDSSKREAGLRLDNYEGATSQLESGEFAVRPEHPEESELIVRVSSDDEGLIMPPVETGKSLSDKQIELLRKWIAQGAQYEPHWAFIPPKKASQFSSSIVSTSQMIDHYVGEKLRTKNIEPSPIASANTLIRRVSLDLIGLPPTLQEVEAFETEYSTKGFEAYEELVSNLLANPHYGERWGRWWLDQARYADSNGYSIDAPRQIWLYRDWVIRALNEDLRFDRFTIEQLAGDLIERADENQIIATGFHRNTQINEEGGIDPEQFRIESIFDRVSTTGSVFLGLTIGCAQCHNHKFDPITQKEYYQLFSFFNSQDEPDYVVYPSDVNAEELSSRKKEIEKEIQRTIDEMKPQLDRWCEDQKGKSRESHSKETLAALDKEPSKRSNAQIFALINAAELDSRASLNNLRAELSQIEKQLARGVKTMVLRERRQPRETHLFIQGDFTRPDAIVSPSPPSVLHSFQSRGNHANRLDLANWIVSRENPLTARVIVNRIWQQYFGRGIVETENDFGLQGSVPTFPELLDGLAVNFMEMDWSLKEIHKAIVLSETYRRSSEVRMDLKEVDPDNYLLSHQTRLRLDAELIRDTALRASGLLEERLGGPPVFPPIPDGVMSQGQVKRDWKASVGPDRFRRGIYTFTYRATPSPSLNVFDAPDGISSCTRRIRSNTPLQALTLLNDLAFVEFAESLAEMIEQEGIASAFKRCTSRQPSEKELGLLEPLDSFSAARVLLNLDETITRE